MPETHAKRNDFASRLLAWYDGSARDLPWRVSPGDRRKGVVPDPYRVFLSEIMLQQTTVDAVRPRFGDFLRRWPDVNTLAAATTEEVMRAWAGLGYYSRARNLHAAARAIVRDHGGAFPPDASALKRLPGIGDYSAAAIAAIAFDQSEAVVDGNVERVIARHCALDKPLPEARKDIRVAVVALVPPKRPGDFAQAMMDLGATVCTPKRADCAACPVSSDCAGRKSGDPTRFPVRAAKVKKPVRLAAAYVATNTSGDVLLRRRPERGLLAGMSEPPTTLSSAREDGALGAEAAPFAADWRLCGTVNHVFTHFELRLDVWRTTVAKREASAGTWWVSPESLDDQGLPTVMKKAIAAALNSKGMSR